MNLCKMIATLMLFLSTLQEVNKLTERSAALMISQLCGRISFFLSRSALFPKYVPADSQSVLYTHAHVLPTTMQSIFLFFGCSFKRT